MARKTNAQQLIDRKYHKPNPIISAVYGILDKTIWVGGKYHPVIKNVAKINKIKGPAFVIWNHQSRRDHCFLTMCTFPRRTSIVAEYTSFFTSHLHTVFKLFNVIPKKVFTNDMNGVRAMRSVIKKGGIVAFSPEGTSSIFGDNQPIVPGTGRFLQAFGVPVYTLHMKGSYLTNNKVDANDRIGKVFVDSELLFSPEDLKNKSAEEIEDIINEDFRHDDYKWNKTAHIAYKAKPEVGMTRNLEDMCYKCPKCGHEFTMKSGLNDIRCTHCGNGATMDEYYDFHPFDETCVIPDTPSDWVHDERQAVINEIRENKDFKMEIKCKLGTLPQDHFIKNYKTSEITGEGVYTIDHSGVHFRGTNNGEPFNFDLDYKTVHTYPMSVDLSIFSLYVNGEYYDFYPEERVVGKVILVTEEMHRLHVNIWKNFKWFDYMYEGKELGIDLKKDK